jgi:hypothetical protein
LAKDKKVWGFEENDWDSQEDGVGTKVRFNYVA